MVMLTFMARLGLILMLVNSLSCVAQWNQLTTSSAPGTRYGSAATYCEARDSMILVHGTQFSSSSGRATTYFNVLSDIWEYSFASKSWTHVDQALAGVPVPRQHASLNALPSPPGTCAAIMIGGATQTSAGSSSFLASNEVWLLNITGNQGSWEKIQLDQAGPSYRSQHRVGMRRGNFVMMGGMRYTSPEITAFNDMWEFTLGMVNVTGTRENSTWASIQTQSSTFTPRYAFAMSIIEGATPADDRLIAFGGISNNDTLGDMGIYNFGTGQWTIPVGVSLERGDTYGMIWQGRFFTFAGFAVVSSQALVFNSFLNTDLTKNYSFGDVNAFAGCTDRNGQMGLWCESFGSSQDANPSSRCDYSFAQRNEEFIIYGGISNVVLDDLWAVNVTTALPAMFVAPADSFGSGSDLASTVYFMIAILSMMVICFSIFVISLRRHRGRQPIFTIGGVQAQTRPVGARPSFVDSLPLKPYQKQHSKTPDVENQEPSTNTNEVIITARSPSTATSDDELHNLCAICLTEYEEGESVRVLPCGHFFHPSCVGQWLANHNACPMCKAVVDPEPLLEGPTVEGPNRASPGDSPTTATNESTESTPEQTHVEVTVVPVMETTQPPSRRQESESANV